MLVVNNVSKSFADQVILKDISLVVSPGERVGYGESVLLRVVTLSIRLGERIALIGENGTGKSTLIKTIVGSRSSLARDISRYNIESASLSVSVCPTWNACAQQKTPDLLRSGGKQPTIIELRGRTNRAVRLTRPNYSLPTASNPQRR